MKKTSVLKVAAYSFISLMIFLAGCNQTTMTKQDETKMVEPVTQETMEMKSSTDTMKKEPMMDTRGSMEKKTTDEKKDEMMK